MLSFRKLFGSYLHALIPHAGLQIRIVSGIVVFAASEERLFQTILRSQVEEDFKAHVYGEQWESCLKEQSFVSDMYHEMRLEKKLS